MTAAPRYREARVGGCLSARVRQGPGGVIELHALEPLGPYPDTLCDPFLRTAAEDPERLLVARRGPDREWVGVSYGAMRERVGALGAALLGRDLSPERPVVILSGNGIEHLELALAAMTVGIPHAPVSPAYSLLSVDFGRLRHIVETLTPGLVMVDDAAAYERAVAAAIPGHCEVVTVRGTIPGRDVTEFSTLRARAPGPEVEAAREAQGPASIVKFLFTSGSTGKPKAVITTNRMLCSNQQMLRQSLAFLQDTPPVLVDWLPWNHVFGGNHNVGIVLYNGGTLYIDDGRPTPAGIGETLQNLREVSPTVYFNVPKGFEEIARAMEGDRALAESLLARAQCFFFAGAGLPQPVWDRLAAVAERTVGERVPIFTGLGMTETAPSSTFALTTDAGAGHIGLPCPGVEVRLVPAGDKHEIRFRGPHVTPGYWRDPESTRAALDGEGFYRTGDAAAWVDPADPARGLRFDGRLAEDFKLSTGTFVSVGPLRTRALLAGAPCVLDVVVAGRDRDEVGLLIFARPEECARLAGSTGGDVRALATSAAVRAFFQDLVDRLWREGTGSASRVARALLLTEPPSIDAGEMTDKGSINQAAVLERRAGLIDRLYEGTGDEPIFVATRRS